MICTRVGTDLTGDRPRKNFEPEYLKQAVEKSRERIGRERVDICLLHNPSILTVERGEAFEALKELAERKVIGVWGVSAGVAGGGAGLRWKVGRGCSGWRTTCSTRADLHAVAGEVAMRGVSVLAHSCAGLRTANRPLGTGPNV